MEVYVDDMLVKSKEEDTPRRPQEDLHDPQIILDEVES